MMIQKYHWAAIAEQRREARREKIRLGLLATRQSELEGDEDKPLPSVPTAFWCGTAAKLDVMQQRAAAGEALFHPMDESRRIMRHPDTWDTRLRFDEDDMRKMTIDG